MQIWNFPHLQIFFVVHFAVFFCYEILTIIQSTRAFEILILNCLAVPCNGYPKLSEIIFLEIIRLLGLGSIPGMANYFFYFFMEFDLAWAQNRPSSKNSPKYCYSFEIITCFLLKILFFQRVFNISANFLNWDDSELMLSQIP